MFILSAAYLANEEIWHSAACSLLQIWRGDLNNLGSAALLLILTMVAFLLYQESDAAAFMICESFATFQSYLGTSCLGTSCAYVPIFISTPKHDLFSAEMACHCIGQLLKASHGGRKRRKSVR